MDPSRLVVLCLVVISSVQAVLLVGAQRPAAMYVFGDSTLDVGNNTYLPGAGVSRANHRYYGVDFPGGIPTGRFSNGYNTADYVAKSMGFVSSPPAYLSLAPSSSGCGGGLLAQTALDTGVSYASGGAGILDSTNAGSTIPLSKQVQDFSATKAKMVATRGNRAVTALLSRSVFLIGIGSNDLFVFATAEQAQNRSAADQQADVATLYTNLVSNYSAAITDLYSMGARRFAVINVGLLGCVPLVRAQDASGACAYGLDQLAAGFDAALASLLADGLAHKLPGLVYSLADNIGLSRDTFADPGASGYTDVSDACCGGGRLGAETDCLPNSTVCADRDRHVFWDRVHPTQRAAFLTAQAFYDGPAKYTAPINFKQLAQTN